MSGNGHDPASPAPVGGILAPPYRAATLGMVALISLIAFEALAVATAMPSVARELHGMKLYAMAFGGMLATQVIGMTLSGRWCDRHGPGPSIRWGLAGFVAGLLMAGSAYDMHMLLLGRLVQGLGAGCLSPAFYVIVGRLYPPALQPKVFAAFSAGWVTPALIGPAISGMVVEHGSWRWVFLAVPLLALPAALALRGALRSLRPPTAPSPAGAGQLLSATAAALGVGLLFLAGQVHASARLAALATALLLLLVSSRRLLPPGTLRAARGLPAAIALRGLTSAAFFGAEAFIPLLLSHQHHWSPLATGLMVSGGALSWFAGAWYQGHYAKISRQALLDRGALSLMVGIGLASLSAWPQLPTVFVVLGWLLSGLGIGLLYATLSVRVLAMSAKERQGANTAALQLSETLSIAITLALGGSLFAGLLQVNEALAFAANFALTTLLALLGLVVTRRTQQTGVE